MECAYYFARLGPESEKSKPFPHQKILKSLPRTSNTTRARYRTLVAIEVRQIFASLQ
jgi:hypothetical protein